MKVLALKFPLQLQKFFFIEAWLLKILNDRGITRHLLENEKFQGKQINREPPFTAERPFFSYFMEILSTYRH